MTNRLQTSRQSESSIIQSTFVPEPGPHGWDLTLSPGPEETRKPTCGLRHYMHHSLQSAELPKAVRTEAAKQKPESKAHGTRTTRRSLAPRVAHFPGKHRPPTDLTDRARRTTARRYLSIAEMETFIIMDAPASLTKAEYETIGAYSEQQQAEYYQKFQCYRDGSENRNTAAREYNSEHVRKWMYYPPNLVYAQKHWAWWCRHTTPRGDLHGSCGRCAGEHDVIPCGSPQASCCEVCDRMTPVALGRRWRTTKRILGAKTANVAIKAIKESLPKFCITQHEVTCNVTAENMKILVKWASNLLWPRYNPVEKALDYRDFYENPDATIEIAEAFQACRLLQSTRAKERIKGRIDICPKWMRMFHTDTMMDEMKPTPDHKSPLPLIVAHCRDEARSFQSIKQHRGLGEPSYMSQRGKHQIADTLAITMRKEANIEKPPQMEMAVQKTEQDEALNLTMPMDIEQPEELSRVIKIEPISPSRPKDCVRKSVRLTRKEIEAIPSRNESWPTAKQPKEMRLCISPICVVPLEEGLEVDHCAELTSATPGHIEMQTIRVVLGSDHVVMRMPVMSGAEQTVTNETLQPKSHLIAATATEQSITFHTATCIPLVPNVMWEIIQPVVQVSTLPEGTHCSPYNAMPSQGIPVNSNVFEPTIVPSVTQEMVMDELEDCEMSSDSSATENSSKSPSLARKSQAGVPPPLPRNPNMSQAGVPPLLQELPDKLPDFQAERQQYLTNPSQLMNLPRLERNGHSKNGHERAPTKVVHATTPGLMNNNIPDNGVAKRGIQINDPAGTIATESKTIAEGTPIKQRRIPGARYIPCTQHSRIPKCWANDPSDIERQRCRIQIGLQRPTTPTEIRAETAVESLLAEREMEVQQHRVQASKTNDPLDALMRTIPVTQSLQINSLEHQQHFPKLKLDAGKLPYAHTWQGQLYGEITKEFGYPMADTELQLLEGLVRAILKGLAAVESAIFEMADQIRKIEGNIDKKHHILMCTIPGIIYPMIDVAVLSVEAFTQITQKRRQEVLRKCKAGADVCFRALVTTALHKETLF